MSTNYDLILIDMNSIGHAAHNARELNHKTYGQVQSIFFGLKMVKKAVEQFSTPGHTEVRALWDHKAQWRYDMYPEYKGKRENTLEKAASRKEYKRQVPVLRNALNIIGIDQHFAKGEEADDLGGALVHNNPGLKILLVTGDQDWLQLVNENVDWYDPREEGKFVSASDFRLFTNCANIAQFIQRKALEGDTSDNIKGVDGIGEKAIDLIFANWGGIPQLMKWVQTGTAFPGPDGLFHKGELPDELSRWRKPMSNLCYGAGMDVFKRNMKLMSLVGPRHRSTEILDKQVILPGTFDKDKFIDLCHEYSFMSIITNMNSWQKTFG